MLLLLYTEACFLDLSSLIVIREVSSSTEFSFASVLSHFRPLGVLNLGVDIAAC